MTGQSRKEKMCLLVLQGADVELVCETLRLRAKELQERLGGSGHEYRTEADDLFEIAALLMAQYGMPDEFNFAQYLPNDTVKG